MQQPDNGMGAAVCFNRPIHSPKLVWSKIANRFIRAVFTLCGIWLTPLQLGNRIGLDMLLFYRIVEQRLDDCLMPVVRRISQMRESIEVLSRPLA